MLCAFVYLITDTVPHELRSCLDCYLGADNTGQVKEVKLILSSKME
jgi:hypothetical protein